MKALIILLWTTTMLLVPMSLIVGGVLDNPFGNKVYDHFDVWFTGMVFGMSITFAFVVTISEYFSKNKET